QSSSVSATVIRVNPRFASVDILCVGSKALKETFRGIIRTQDVRATEVDKVEIYKSFRPGDIVRAEVISLGDSRSYYLSTAKNELGVVFATSMAGSTMIPISWNQMQCPKTKVVESRKVAKVV
ncbi:Exosome complex component CSL4, partial [Balamuthia mandrillaris]